MEHGFSPFYLRIGSSFLGDDCLGVQVKWPIVCKLAAPHLPLTSIDLVGLLPHRTSFSIVSLLGKTNLMDQLQRKKEKKRKENT